MKNKILGLLMAAAFMLGVVVTPPVFAGRIIERILVRVNNSIITQHMYEEERAKLRAQLAQKYSGAELQKQFNEQSKNLIRDLIDQALLVQKAKDLNINVETEVIKRLDQIRQSLGLNSLDDLQKQVEAQGMNWEDFKDNIRRNLLMREVIGREVGGRIIISRNDARKYFKKHKEMFKSPGGVHLAQILISTTAHKPAEADKRAKEALAALQSGKRFSNVAEQYSDDPTASNGGDAGFFKTGTLAPDIAAAIKNLDVGETTGLVKTKHGYMIFKVLEKLPPGIPTFDDVEQRVDEILYEQKMQPALRKYLVKLRKESYIYLTPGLIDTGATTSGESMASNLDTTDE